MTNIIGVFMLGSEKVRIKFSNELNFCLGLELINRAEFKMALTLSPLPVSLGN